MIAAIQDNILVQIRKAATGWERKQKLQRQTINQSEGGVPKSCNVIGRKWWDVPSREIVIWYGRVQQQKQAKYLLNFFWGKTSEGFWV